MLNIVKYMISLCVAPQWTSLLLDFYCKTGRLQLDANQWFEQREPIVRVARPNQAKKYSQTREPTVRAFGAASY